MAKIFISYDRASKDVVEQLVQDFTDDDHEIWFDQHLTGGQNWWDNILSQIRQCEIFVAALTPAFLESKACQRELNYATDLQRRLLPVRLSDKISVDSLPSYLSELQWADYSLRSVEAFRGLQQALRNLPKAQPFPDPLPDPPLVPFSHLGKLRAKADADSQFAWRCGQPAGINFVDLKSFTGGENYGTDLRFIDSAAEHRDQKHRQCAIKFRHEWHRAADYRQRWQDRHRHVGAP